MTTDIGIDSLLLKLEILIVLIIDYYRIWIVRQSLYYRISMSFKFQNHHFININTIGNFPRSSFFRANSFHQLFVDFTFRLKMVSL